MNTINKNNSTHSQRNAVSEEHNAVNKERNTAIEVSNLQFSYTKESPPIIDIKAWQVSQGEHVFLSGPSGSGKSTLLNLLCGTLTPTQGDIALLEQPFSSLSNRQRDKFRACHIGVVFQQFNLVTRLSVLTNVLMGLLGSVPIWRGTIGHFTRDEKMKAMMALDRVGIADHASKRASNLSGGQQQRAAIARALTQGAKLILADEPIASLDPASSKKVMNTLERINKEDGITVVVSLHQVDYALKYCPRTIAMRDGEIVFDGASEKLTPAFLMELYGEESAELFADKKTVQTIPTPVREEEFALAAG